MAGKSNKIGNGKFEESDDDIAHLKGIGDDDIEEFPVDELERMDEDW